MDILVAHNFYKQPGGEDQCVAAEIAMLRAYGHRVWQYSVSNDLIDTMGYLQLASRTIWSQQTFRELRRMFQTHRPQIAHFHNTFPLISPSAYYAAQAESVRVVQTVHNFRLCCANGILFRDGTVCEDCLDSSSPWWGIVHKCYRNSRVASAGAVSMLATHRALGSWWRAVDLYIALTEFSRRKLVEGGLPASKIAVKPNFVYPDPGAGAGRGGYAIFVGRLSQEKGLETLLSAWRLLDGILPLKIAGSGPMAVAVQEAASNDVAIQFLGPVSFETVNTLIGEATVLVLTSEWYENFPRVLVEAFAKGTPVIASKLGAMAEIVDDGRTGLHFKPGDAADLAAKVRLLLAEPRLLAQMRRAAREKFDESFTAESNYKRLMALYELTLKRGTELASPSGCSMLSAWS
jgi:glycosyltransferase involved in cell wall biosynthesis